MRRLLPVTLLPMLAAGALSAVALAGQGHTQTTIYRAFKSNGTPAIHVTKTVKGSCIGGSSAIDREDAWRCTHGNFIVDPCFSSAKAKGIVLCPTAAWTRSGIEITLTKALPTKLGDKGEPSTSGMPWAIETTSGMKCAFATGATWSFHGLRANYDCAGGTWLYGNPGRSHQPWTIQAGSAHPKKLHPVSIKTAWF